jgi:glycosyltransferase 2 family protein
LKQHTGVHANFFSSGKKMRANLQVSSGLEKGKLRKRLILKSQSRAYLLWWGRAAITVGLSAYLIWRVHEELLHIQLNLTQPVRLVLVVGLAAVGIFLSTWLWRIFIPYPNQVPFRQLMAHYLVGMLSNNFLPGGFGGDAVRVITLRSNTGNTETALNSVLISRLVSLWSIAIVAVLAALLQLFYRGFSQAVPLLFISGAALIGTAWITIFLLGAPLGFLMRHLPQKWANWHARLHHDYKDILPLLMALVIALSIQVCAILINLQAAKALGLPITAWHLWLTLPLITLISMLPISIGGFGVRESSYVVLLGFLGVPASDAIILSLAVYALLVVVTAVGAAISLLFLTGAGSKSLSNNAEDSRN